VKVKCSVSFVQPSMSFTKNISLNDELRRV
jgi:hypothetical protein